MGAQTISKLTSNPAFLLFKGVIDLLISYGFGSWAIDSGSYWHYLLAIIFMILGVKMLMHAANVIRKR